MTMLVTLISSHERNHTMNNKLNFTKQKFAFRKNKIIFDPNPDVNKGENIYTFVT